VLLAAVFMCCLCAVLQSGWFDSFLLLFCWFCFVVLVYEFRMVGCTAFCICLVLLLSNCVPAWFFSLSGVFLCNTSFGVKKYFHPKKQNELQAA
jgi:hypothetical protein